MFDVAKLRADFPILDRRIGDRPLVYLDSAATSQKPRQVVDAIKTYYERHNANVHRAAHTLSTEATEMYEQARLKVARFINAPDPTTVIWTRGTTESINLVASGYGQRLQAGDKIVLTPMEHHSNLVPWQQLARSTGAELVYLEIDAVGRIDLNRAERTIDRHTKLVAATHISNVLGVVNPISQLAAIAHKRGAVLVVDGAQSVPHMTVDVTALDCDFLAFSAHKMLGPTGVGVLYGKRELLESMPPVQFGGEMISEVSYTDAAWNVLPYKFEAGTPNIAGVYATGVAVDYLTDLGMDDIWQHELQLTSYALERLAELEAFTIIGPSDSDQRGGVISFIHPQIHPHDLGTALDRWGVAIRTGHHCAMPLIYKYGVTATARASFYLYNTKQEVDILCEALHAAEEFFQR